MSSEETQCIEIKGAKLKLKNLTTQKVVLGFGHSRFWSIELLQRFRASEQTFLETIVIRIKNVIASLLDLRSGVSQNEVF